MEQKITTRTALKELCEKWRQEDLVIGFTSGSFDLMHAGHVSYLDAAKKQCDVLIVGLNSNQSVRSYKDKRRPIVDEQARLQVLAALECVSYVFLFDELNNEGNIISLKPHLYIKAADYQTGNLSSAHHLQKWDGKVLLLPLKDNISTTNIINTILKRYAPEQDNMEKFFVGASDTQATKSAPVVFLDRDGVLNKEVEYLHDPKDFELLPGVIEGLQALYKAGLSLVVVTNQAGIGLGYFSKEDFYRVNKKMLTLFYENDILLRRIYYCGHAITDKCTCRKPNTGLIDKAHQDMKIDIEHSFMVGDKTSDILAGKRAFLTTVLVSTGHGGADKQHEVTPDYHATDFLSAAKWILQQYKPNG